MMKSLILIPFIMLTFGCGSITDLQKERITDSTMRILEIAANTAITNYLATDSQVEGVAQ